MPRAWCLVLAAASAAVLAPAPARADYIYCSDGRIFEGDVTESKDNYNVRLYGGKTVKVPRSEVKNSGWVKARLSWKVYEERLRAIPADAPDFTARHLELARFCKENRLDDLAKKEYQVVLQKDPANADAHKGLGEVEFAGKWFRSEKDRDSYRKTAPAAAMEPLGYVKHNGLWEKKEDVERMQKGLKLFRGKWLTEEEIKQTQGFVKDKDGKWVYARDLDDASRREEVSKAMGEKVPTVASSRHFRFVSWYPVGETAKFREKAEKAYAWIREAMGLKVGKTDDEEEEELFTVPIEVYVLITGERKDKWIDAFGAAYGFDAGAVEFYKKGASWHRLAPGPYMVLGGKKTEKNRERSPEEDQEYMESTLCSLVGRVALDRVRAGHVAGWLGEGTGFMTEIRYNESADCCYVSETKYREETASKSGSRAKYWNVMKDQFQKRQDRPLREIFSLELNKLDWFDCLKAWAFLEFLIARYPDKYRSLMQTPFPQPDEITPDQIRAASNALKPKDPSAAVNDPRRPPKQEAPVPDQPLKITGPGAVQVTDGSREEGAARSASMELWLAAALGKDIVAIESEFKEWTVNSH